jgi:hypothetical protein
MPILQKIAAFERQFVRSIRFFTGFFVHHTTHLRLMSRPGFGCSAGFQPTQGRQDGDAGNPEPELDRPCTEGRPDEKRPSTPSSGAPESALSRPKKSTRFFGGIRTENALN